VLVLVAVSTLLEDVEDVEGVVVVVMLVVGKEVLLFLLSSSVLLLSSKGALRQVLQSLNMLAKVSIGLTVMMGPLSMRVTISIIQGWLLSLEMKLSKSKKKQPKVARSRWGLH